MTWTTEDYAYAAYVGFADHRDSRIYLDRMPGAPRNVSCAEDIVMMECGSDRAAQKTMRDAIIDRYYETEGSTEGLPDVLEPTNNGNGSAHGNCKWTPERVVWAICKGVDQMPGKVSGYGYEQFHHDDRDYPKGRVVTRNLPVSIAELLLVMGYEDRMAERSVSKLAGGMGREGIERAKRRAEKAMADAGLAHLLDRSSWADLDTEAPQRRFVWTPETAVTESLKFFERLHPIESKHFYGNSAEFQRARHDGIMVPTKRTLGKHLDVTPLELAIAAGLEDRITERSMVSTTRTDQTLEEVRAEAIRRLERRGVAHLLPDA